MLIATLAASSALIVSAQGQWFDAYREGRTAFQTKGSGFIVTAAKGLHIVTALHVLAPEDGPKKEAA